MLSDVKIVKNYANSLFGQIDKNLDTDIILDDIKDFNALLNDKSHLLNIFISPIISKASKINILNILAQRLQLHSLVKNFIEVLINNSRISLIPFIIQECESIQKIENNITLVEVISYNELTTQDINYVQGLLEQELQSKIEIKLTIDNRLLGGMIFRYNSYLIDCSILGALNRIQRINIK